MGIGKADSKPCFYCEDDDHAAHTLFDCAEWENQRRAVTWRVGKHLCPDNILHVILKSETNWNEITEIITDIIKTKETDGRQRERHEDQVQ